MLSEREQQILVLVAQGLSNKQIAVQLGISDNTVKVHLRNIFSKINVASRTEASLYAVRHGLLTVAPARGDDVPPPAPRRQWHWWASVLIAVGVVAVLVVGWWYTRTESVPTQAATPTRWRMLPALPQSMPGVQLANYQGTLLALAGNQWWQLTGVDAQWQEQSPLPCALATGRVWADGAGMWLVGCGDGSEVWFWDGHTWQPRALWQGEYPIRAVVRIDGMLWAWTDTALWQLAAQNAPWQQIATMPQRMRDMRVVVVDGGVYVFGDDVAVWHVDTRTTTWRRVHDLPFHAHTLAVSSVLGSVLIADATVATLWAYTPSQGVVSAQMVPPTVQIGTQAVQWQSYVLFPNADGSAIPAYQAVFQTFVPVMPEP